MKSSESGDIGRSKRDQREHDLRKQARATEKDLTKRLRKLDSRLNGVADQSTEALQAVAAAPAPQGSAGALCPQCGERVEEALARVKAMASTLHDHAPAADGDIRDRLVVQSMLGDLSVATTQFRKMLAESDRSTEIALDALRALSRDVKRALEHAELDLRDASRDGKRGRPAAIDHVQAELDE